MTTYEDDTFTAAACPCGAGRVARDSRSYDNPWSGADVSYRLECATCASEWRLDTGLWLVLRSSETASRQAAVTRDKCSDAIHTLVSDLVDTYFNEFAARSKKAEMEEMQRLGIYSGSYRSFLKEKRKGHSQSRIAYGLANKQWLHELAVQRGIERQLSQCLMEYEAANAAHDAACQQIVRRKAV